MHVTIKKTALKLNKVNNIPPITGPIVDAIAIRIFVIPISEPVFPLCVDIAKSV
jgi:hypothetical protein